MTSSAMLA